MSSYVNLLSENEIQYHSAAADSKTFKYGMYGAAALLAIVGAGLFLSYKSATNKATKLRERWAYNEPIYEKSIANKAELKEAQGMLAEIRGWPIARIEPSKLLTGIQDHVPPEMQVTRLTLVGSIAGIENSGRRERSGKIIAVKEPERHFNLRIEGLVAGELSENTILNFVKLLQTEDVFAEYFQNVEFKEALPAVIQHFETNEEQNALRFSIECQFKPRKILWTGKA